MSEHKGGGPWDAPEKQPEKQSGSESKKPERNPARKPDATEGDIEAWLHQSQKRLRGLFVNHDNMAKGSPQTNPANPRQRLRFALSLAFGLWLFSGFYQVASNQQGVVMRFGEMVRLEAPGLHYHLPAPLESVLLPDVTSTHQLKLGMGDGAHNDGKASESRASESRMLTGDENIVAIDFSVFWRVDNVEHFLFNSRQPETMVQLASESAIREVVGQMKIQPILTEKRSEIELATAALIQKILDDYKAGIKITGVQLLNVAPPQPVLDAFNDVQRARADAERSRNEAEATRNKIIPVAKGDAQTLLQEAEAYKAQIISLAKGEAARFESVRKAYAAAKEVTSTHLYLETMEAVLGGAHTLVVDPGTGKGGVVPYLPLQNLLQAKKE